MPFLSSRSLAARRFDFALLLLFLSLSLSLSLYNCWLHSFELHVSPGDELALDIHERLEGENQRERMRIEREREKENSLSFFFLQGKGIAVESIRARKKRLSLSLSESANERKKNTSTSTFSFLLSHLCLSLSSLPHPPPPLSPALVEALMGFQFNHVGGGTKTRRPITLHMKYNSACVQPICFLCTDDSSNASSASSSSAPPSNEDAELTLEELREYIEAENARLEREGQFWAKEIVVKIEYKYCPNLTIIDTPGLISAAPGRRNHGLQASARQVEAMVRAKMEQREYIILCLEDSNDWSNATTRRLVMAVDPHLSRSVVVSTKLDTRLPQFARGSDVELFLRPPGRLLEPGMLGGCPFFTSVPSGRVGNAKDAVFRSNEHFRAAVAEREAADVDELERRLDRRLDRGERARIGVTQLRRFLEQLLQRRYLENVPAIVPLLEREYRCAARRLEATQEELNDLHPDKLKDKGRSFREAFLSKLGLLLRGTVAAPADRFGETLADEHVRGGAFVLPDGKPLAPSPTLANAHMRLYGGAQYHRAMAEFRSGVGSLPCPDIS